MAVRQWDGPTLYELILKTIKMRILQAEQAMAPLVVAVLAVFALVEAQNTTTAPAFTIDDCPMVINRDKYLQIHRAYCYEFVTYRKLDYEDSSAYCSSRGGSLVKIDSLADQLFIHGQLFTTYNVQDAVWIGLTDHNSDDVWEWERDGSVPSYTNWAPGQPGVGHGLGFEDCAAMEPTDAGQWHDYRCNDLLFISFGHPFVCQFGPINGVVVDELTDAPTMRPTRQTSPMMDALTNTTDSGMMQGDNTTKDLGVLLSNMTIANLDFSNSTYVPKTTPEPSLNVTAVIMANNTLDDVTDVCPPFACGLDCGLDGYQTSPQGCQICVCDV